MKKQIKAITDFGIVEVKKIGKVIEICGEMWVCAEVPCKYMNREEPLFLTQVLHYKTGRKLPLTGLGHRSTAKDHLSKAESFLSRISDEEIKKELGQHETINHTL